MQNKVRFLLAAGLAWASVVACSADEGDNNNGGGGGNVCDTSMQKLPASCDAATRTCNGAVVPADTEACTQCRTSAAQRNQTGALSDCACQNCAVQLAACFESATREPGGDANRDSLCSAVVLCGQRNNCAGSDCFCGTGVDLIQCATDPGNGPCADEIAAAAGCPKTDAACILVARGMADTALFRADAVSNCTRGDPSAMPPVVGNCAGL